MSFMVSETISEMLETLIKIIQESQRLPMQKMWIRSKKLFWGTIITKEKKSGPMLMKHPQHVS